MTLRQVMTSIALTLSTTLPVLLKRFGQELDLASSFAQLAILMDTDAQQKRQSVDPTMVHNATAVTQLGRLLQA